MLARSPSRVVSRLPSRAPIEGVGAAITSIETLFATGVDGFYFDFSKTDRLFQDALGQTLADDAGENIALALDSAKWGGRALADELAAQTDLVANGDFSAGTLTGWSSFSGGSGAIVSNQFRVTASGTYSGQDYSLADSTAVGRFYMVKGTLVSGAARFTVQDGATNYFPNLDSTGPKSFQGVVSRVNAVVFSIRLRSRDAGGVTTWDDISAKPIVGNHGTQATASFQPKWQAGGISRFDGADDNLLTTKIAGTSGTIMARCKPTSGAALQVLAGAVGAGGTDRIYLGVDASNQATCRIGSGAALSGSVSIAGADGTIGVRWNGTTVDLLVNGFVVDTQAQSGAPTTTTPLRIGGYNSNGTATNFFTGDVWDVVEADKALTDAAALAIHNQLMAA